MRFSKGIFMKKFLRKDVFIILRLEKIVNRISESLQIRNITSTNKCNITEKCPDLSGLIAVIAIPDDIHLWMWERNIAAVERLFHVFRQGIVERPV